MKTPALAPNVKTPAYRLGLGGLLLALTLPTAQAQDTQTTEPLPDLGGRKLVVAVENAYPPLQFLDKTGTATGWEYELVAEIARRLHLTVSYESISWDAMIAAVAAGQYDMAMDGITITEERMETVDFSAPYMRSEMLMIARADEARFTDAASFAADPKLLIAAQPGTSPFYAAVYNILDGNEDTPRIVRFETFGAGLQALKVGDVDLTLSDSTAANGYVAASGGTLKIVGEPLASEEFGFIFPKGSDLVAPIDAVIDQMQVDGTLTALNKKWFLDYKMGE